MHQGHDDVAARHRRATEAARGARATTTTQVQLGCVTRERRHAARARRRGRAHPWRVARKGNRGGLLLDRSSLTCPVSKPAHVSEQSIMCQGHDDVAARHHRATEAARGGRDDHHTNTTRLRHQGAAARGACEETGSGAPLASRSQRQKGWAASRQVLSHLLSKQRSQSMINVLQNF